MKRLKKNLVVKYVIEDLKSIRTTNEGTNRTLQASISYTFKETNPKSEVPNSKFDQ